LSGAGTPPELRALGLVRFRPLVVLITIHIYRFNQSESKMSFTPPAGMDKACIPGDVDNGEKLFKARCTQCHTINKVPEISHQPSSRYLALTFSMPLQPP
jgi:hypothetical protein